jgi:hypothetical protein
MLLNSSGKTENLIQKDDRLEIISLIILVGFVISIFYHYVNGSYLGLSYPYDTFLFDPLDKFNDFFNMINICKNLNPYFEPYWFKSNYFPFANLIFYFFSFFKSSISLNLYSAIFVSALVFFNVIMLTGKKINYFRYSIFNGVIFLYVVAFPAMNHSFRVFWLIVTLTFLFFYLKRFNLKAIDVDFLKNIFVISFLTYPFLFTVDRGNIEMFLFIFLGLFIYLHQRQQFLVGGLFLGLAIALKLYPAVFIVLLISEKKFKTCLWSLTVALVVTLAGLLLFKGGFWANFNFMISGFDTSPWAGFFELNGKFQRGTSLYSLLKMVLVLLITQANLVQLGSVDMDLFLKGYTILTFVLFAFISFFILFFETELWKKLALLVFSMLLLPHFSADYRLIHLFFPIAFFIKSKEESTSQIFYAISFALLMIPKNYYYFEGFMSEGKSDISIGMVINILVILLMTVSILREGFARTSKEDVKKRFVEYGQILLKIFGYRAKKNVTVI